MADTTITGRNKRMAPRAKAGLCALALLALAGAAFQWQVPAQREIQRLDLTLDDGLFEPADAGGGYGRYAFLPPRGETVDFGVLWSRGAAPWPSPPPAPDDRYLLLPYAGFGVGPFKLSMSLRDLDLRLRKDKSSRRPRAFAGIGYEPWPDLRLGLEYRTVTNGESPFGLDADNPVAVQSVSLTARYRF